MMIKLVVSLALVACVWAASFSNSHTKEAAACNEKECVLPDCQCSSTSIPGGLNASSIPQFVFLTFDDAVTAGNFEVYKSLFDGRINPDGCKIGTTYFVSHEYTDYSKVHELYVNGHEIALHSVTHSALTTYWQNMTVDALKQEFGEEKTIITKFAKIPEEAIKGMRIPFLQLSGSNSFQALADIGLEYDCSWPTQTFTDPGLYPYTLDYLSNQDCPVGPCPKDSLPGVWVAPMLDWTDQENVVCAMVDSCVNIPSDEDELLQWFIDNFNVQYQGNKAPFGFYVHAAWFDVNEVHLTTYQRFVDYLQGLSDVYIVSVSTAIDYYKNPVSLDSESWPECKEVIDDGCTPLACELKKDEEYRYMTICSEECPNVFPWLNNPLGE